MTRPTITRLFVSGLIAAVVGSVLFSVAAVLGLREQVLIMNGPDVVGLRPGAVINTASLPSKTWLVLELVMGLLGFPFVAVLVYVVGRPQATAPDQPQTGSARPSTYDRRSVTVSSGR